MTHDAVIRPGVKAAVAVLVAVLLYAGPTIGAGEVTGEAVFGAQPVMSDLNEPRGLLVADDGSICVAEAGHADVIPADVVTAGRIDTVTGSISCLRPNGVAERVAEGIAYVRYPTTGVSTGAADLVELDGRIFVLVGESFGPGSRTISEVRTDGSGLSVVADLLAFAREQTPEGVTDGLLLSNPFAMVYQEDQGRFLVTDGATGHVLAVGLDGTIDVFSRAAGNRVLTGIALDPNGSIHVASFSPLPHAEGAGSILQVDANGRALSVIDGLTMPIDIEFDSDGRMLVLEFAGGSADDPYGGAPGRVLRLSPLASGWSVPETLVDGLAFPTALAVLEDDTLLVSVHGAFSERGAGRVERLPR